MSQVADGRLVLLAAEIRAECVRVGTCVKEMQAAVDALTQEQPRTLEIYGAAALLDSFYSGVEKALERIAQVFDVVPVGSAWHRELLDTAALELPGVRPAVLGASVVRDLDAYLAFRHRFRHLYVFDLEPDRLLPLLRQASAVWHMAEAALVAFAERVVSWG